MKRSLAPFIGLLTLGTVIVWSCSNSTTSPTNFQGPVTTIVGINPTLSPTPSFTPTSTTTSTPTQTPTSTSTPYAVSTWTGFSSPSAIAVDGNNMVYVADTGNNLVKRFNSNGTLDITWGAGGLKGAVSIYSPLGVAVAGNGTLYVTSGDQVSQYVTVGSGVSLVTNSFSVPSLSGPQGVAVNAAGSTIAIADSANDRVVILNNVGALQATYAFPSALYGVAFDGSGNVFASTGSANTVVELYASPVTIPGFSDPRGLFMDASNNIWVADGGNKQVEAFAPAGGLLQPPFVNFNASGTLNNPSGVAVDASGNIYVTDSLANKVVKFAP
jgi:streptogramin lyase